MTNFEKWKEGLTAGNCESFMLEVLQQVFPDFKLTIPKEVSEKFLAWANAEAGESVDETDPNQTDLFDGESQ